MGSTDTNRTRVSFRVDSGRGEAKFRHAEKDARRDVLAGYPIHAPFATPEDAYAYLDRPLILCLLCGKEYKTLVTHIQRIHGMTVREYQERYHLPFSRGLSGGTARAKMSAHSKDPTHLRQLKEVRGLIDTSARNPASESSFKRKVDIAKGTPAITKINAANAAPRMPCVRCGKPTTASTGGVHCSWGCRYPEDREPVKRESGWARARKREAALL